MIYWISVLVLLPYWVSSQEPVESSGDVSCKAHSSSCIIQEYDEAALLRLHAHNSHGTAPAPASGPALQGVAQVPGAIAAPDSGNVDGFRTVRIGGPMQFSGDYESFGQNVLIVLEMWKHQINTNQNGRFKFRVELNFQDSGDSVTQAVSILENLKDNLDIFFAPYGSTALKELEYVELSGSNANKPFLAWSAIEKEIFEGQFYVAKRCGSTVMDERARICCHQSGQHQVVGSGDQPAEAVCPAGWTKIDGTPIPGQASERPLAFGTMALEPEYFKSGLDVLEDRGATSVLIVESPIREYQGICRGARDYAQSLGMRAELRQYPFLPSRYPATRADYVAFEKTVQNATADVLIACMPFYDIVNFTIWSQQQSLRVNAFLAFHTTTAAYKKAMREAKATHLTCGTMMPVQYVFRESEHKRDDLLRWTPEDFVRMFKEKKAASCRPEPCNPVRLKLPTYHMASAGAMLIAATHAINNLGATAQEIAAMSDDAFHAGFVQQMRTLNIPSFYGRIKFGANGVIEDHAVKTLQNGAEGGPRIVGPKSLADPGVAGDMIYPWHSEECHNAMSLASSGSSMSGAGASGASGGGGGSCFPHDAKVIVRSGVRSMHQLHIGDEVLGFDYNTGKPEFTKVRAWIHRSSNGNSSYTKLRTDKGHILASGTHNLAVGAPGTYAFAQDIGAGSTLVTPDGIITVRSSTLEMGQGMYAPLTWTSNFFVGFGEDSSLPMAILAHSFAALPYPRLAERPLHILFSIVEFFRPSIHSDFSSSTTNYVHPICRFLSWVAGVQIHV
eukprot:gnl/TRDRNA2_/TRDRNA2_152923_c2_seq2.p1 gnl/TRDRNA2_/TRDRNA2_152923_c2~~gnl/TRDRNA2_/TRDRNA2_152923_c2_seq2.p1  ORF type:complete len:787 (+),score=96.98 gnl/TRDRNA2_/TRDRNA2_152923_c2_seq2:64-2424(+)